MIIVSIMERKKCLVCMMKSLRKKNEIKNHNDFTCLENLNALCSFIHILLLLVNLTAELTQANYFPTRNKHVSYRKIFLADELHLNSDKTISKFISILELEAFHFSEIHKYF